MQLADSGVVAAMATLKRLASREKQLELEGHVYAHGVGIKAFLAAGEVAKPFGQCPTDFASGCGHGVIQAYLESEPSLGAVSLNQLCAPYRGENAARWTLFQCVHGMGHGLVMMYRGELPKALLDCDQLADGWDRDSCYGGAFMENIMQVTAPHHPASELSSSHHHGQGFQALDSTDLLYPCSVVEGRYHRACYEIQTAAILHFTKGKIGPASDVCDRAPDAMRPTCYASLGRDISSKASRNPARSIRYCRETGAVNRSWCYYGVAKALVDWEAKPDHGFALCRQLGADSAARLCYFAIGEQIAALAPAAVERANQCRGAGTDAGIDACLAAVGLSRSDLPPAP